MPAREADVVLHIDEATTHAGREHFREHLLAMDGVLAASCHDEKPHLMVIMYNPDVVSALEFVNLAREQGLHAELIGL